jgi:hypothetical protein
MAHDVFISYSALDKAVADAVCATLESRKIRCWIAPRDVLPSIPFAEALIDGINKSRLMVLVFSNNSNQSPQVMREVERAVNKGIPILPFRIEDVILSKSMEYFLSVPHWLDALTPPLEEHLQILADTVGTILGADVPPITEAAFPDKAITKVEQKNKIKPIYFIAGIAVVAIIILAIFLLRGGSDKGPDSLSTSNATSTTQVTAELTTTTTLAPTPTPTPTPSITQALPFEDDFSNPLSGWQRFISDEYEANYVDGEYHLWQKSSGARWVWNFGQLTDFVLEIDARSVNGTNDSSYGVIFRLSDNNHLYRFMVSGSGSYRIEKYIDGVWFFLQDTTNSAFIKQGNSTNHLKVICKGDQIEVYANGNYLATVFDDSLHTGYVGMSIDTLATVDAYFDNIKVYSAE